MKKISSLLIQGFVLGLGLGLCFAGALGLLYRAIHSGDAHYPPGPPTLFFFVVGIVMGLLGGWCLALQLVLSNLLASLFMKIAELVPMPAQVVGEEWARKMETFFNEVIQPMPGFFRKVVEFFLISRFEDYGRINRAIDKAKRKSPQSTFTPEWLSMVVLHYFLEPLWLFFYAAYAILFLAACFFWSLPFLRPLIPNG